MSRTSIANRLGQRIVPAEVLPYNGRKSRLTGERLPLAAAKTGLEESIPLTPLLGSGDGH